MRKTVILLICLLSKWSNGIPNEIHFLYSALKGLFIDLNLIVSKTTRLVYSKHSCGHCKRNKGLTYAREIDPGDPGRFSVSVVPLQLLISTDGYYYYYGRGDLEKRRRKDRTRFFIKAFGVDIIDQALTMARSGHEKLTRCILLTYAQYSKY